MSLRVSGNRPGDDEIRACLEAVPDPEIPVISVIDLGIVRWWRWQDSPALARSTSQEPALQRSAPQSPVLVVAVTPTYCGCPANDMIAADIRAALLAHGIAEVRIERQLTPPWTTDWLTEKGRARLRQFGIAPPVGLAAGGASTIPRVVSCPHCGADDTALVSRFGSTPCKAQYRCRQCLEPFDYFKCY